MNRICKKKIGTTIFHSIIMAYIILMVILSFIIGIIIVSRIAFTSKEAIRSEAEAGNELIRIYISIDEIYETSNVTLINTTISRNATRTITITAPIVNKKEETRITITNQWGKTSVIDYFVIEDWNNRIISKGDLNIILGAGEERLFKGNEMINTFKLNDNNYNDFWYFKSKIRCITLHTKLGNTFGSAYYPIKVITKNAEREAIIYNYKTITVNQTLLPTTYYGEYTLIIESSITFIDCVDPINNVWRNRGTYNEIHNLYVYQQPPGTRKNIMYDIINPNYDPYGRRMVDGQYNYPAGILLTISHSLPWSYSGDGFVYYKNTDNRIMNLDGGVGVSLMRLELWELDQFGNEKKKILETTSNSITFAIFGNYKLKRFFEAKDRGQVITKTTTTITYTITKETSYKYEEQIGSIHWVAVRKDGENQYNTLYKKADSGWWIEIIGYKYDTHGNGNALWGEKNSGPNQYEVWIEAYCIFTTNDPNAYIEFWMYYKEYRYIPA